MEPVIYQFHAPRPAGAPSMLNQGLERADDLDFNLVRVAPGTGRAPHTDDDGNSLMLILAGELLLNVDQSLYKLLPGNLALIPRGAMRGYIAGARGATFVASHLRG